MDLELYNNGEVEVIMSYYLNNSIVEFPDQVSSKA